MHRPCEFESVSKAIYPSLSKVRVNQMENNKGNDMGRDCDVEAYSNRISFLRGM